MHLLTSEEWTVLALRDDRPRRRRDWQTLEQRPVDGWAGEPIAARPDARPAAALRPARLGIPLLAVAATQNLRPFLEGAGFECPLFAMQTIVKPPFDEKPEVRKVGPLFRVG